LKPGWRVGQVSNDVARVVVESPAMASQFVPKFKPARSFMVRLTSEPFEQVIEEEPPVVTPPITGGPQVNVTVAPKATAVVSVPNLAKEDDTGATFLMPFTGTLKGTPGAKYLDSKTIQISVPESEPSNDGATTVYESKYVLHSESRRTEQGHTVVTFTLADACAFELKNNERIITLRVFKPREATGGLAKKVIVVDAGHGGRESGTKWGNILEKDLTLKVAKKLAAQLIEAGASVIMIRSEDTTVPLLSRPETANQSKADLYISVHFNSNQTANSASGGMTFYHMQDPVSMMLAQCIQTEIAAVSKLPDLGVWSDSRIYKTKGFAVLRGASMPAVLIELGFLNNSKDRARLVQNEFHDDAAKAILKGIKTFLGDGDGR
jgi:N-acetylmuramoyl-L-alanine amidase